MDLVQLITAYYTEIPDPNIREQRVSFGTSGHRGSSLNSAFNEWHILAITQAICDYRKAQGINGPLFLGIDTHALSVPARASAVEVLAANGVDFVLSDKDEYTPTPVISHAILVYNKGKKNNLSDGIVVTPSHNPPPEGGFKYNPPNGGPADTQVTDWIQKRANDYLVNKLSGVKRLPYEQALQKSRRYNYRDAYIDDLKNVLNFDLISKVHLGVDPLGGAGVHYWHAIAERYNLNLTVVSEVVDPTFSFMPPDWDGKIRMDPSSPDAMKRLISLKDKFQVAFGCDTDHDRHGIVTQSVGLMNPNHYLSVALYYLFQHRPQWNKNAQVGKTLVSSQMIDRVAGKLGRKVYEVPVGFKWFVDGLINGSLGFVGEESAGASFLRRDGTVWTTDKDGIIAALLAGEITAALGKDPGLIYRDLTEEFGDPKYTRIDAKATPEEKEILKKLTPEQVTSKDLAGEKIEAILTKAPGNGAPIGGLKVVAKNGWFAARPSGTEEIYKIYAESFLGEEHLKKIVKEAEEMVNAALKAGVA